MNGEYIIERLNGVNLKDVAMLHALVYCSSKPQEYWETKYDTSWTGVSYTGYIAYDAKLNPVAFYGVIPCFINTQNGAVLVAQSADTMTHPLHQNKGLFIRLADMTFSLCRENDIRLIFGFPNQRSYHGLVNKLGWQQTEVMQVFHIKTATFSFQRIARIPVISKIYSFYHHLVFRRVIIKNCLGIQNSMLTEGYDGLLRSKAYFENKAYNKTFVVEINDWRIWMKTGETLIIGDVERGQSSFGDIMKQLKKLALLSGISRLTLQVSKDSFLYNELLSLNKATNGFSVLFLKLDRGIDISRIRFTFADIDVF